MSNRKREIDENNIETIMEQIVSAAQAIPLEKNLTEIINDSKKAAQRSYYLPDEDERLREIFASYLRVRSLLIEAINNVTPTLKNKLNRNTELRTFTAGFTAACMLIRATKYIIHIARKNPLTWKKLDEAEVRYGIERKTISLLYESLSSPKKMIFFHQATRFFEKSKKEIMASAKNSKIDYEIIQLLIAEEPFIESRKRDFIKLRLKYRAYDIIRRNSSGYKKAMFHLFRLTGSTIAELKQPLKQSNKNPFNEKRVTQHTLNEISPKLMPGDIIITRHNDALSNLFLPGYWPHAALYIGNTNQLQNLKANRPINPKHTTIEAKKDGVKLRTIEETLNVDNFVIIRPKLNNNLIKKIVESAQSHAGKRYDFLFDFTKADRLACTELIYRTYHGVNNITFTLNERSGRKCISAEDLIDQTISSGQFSVFAIYTEKTQKIIYLNEATSALKDSYASNW